jgi:hypothetical protein
MRTFSSILAAFGACLSLAFSVTAAVADSDCMPGSTTSDYCEHGHGHHHHHHHHPQLSISGGAAID